MATCTQAVICQCSTLGCIICRKITCYTVFIMRSTFMHIVLTILFMIYIRSKHIRIRIQQLMCNECCDVVGNTDIELI